jgi:hypothetical protein
MSLEKNESEIFDESYISAIDLWCDQYHPCSIAENAQMVSMQDILEALDSLYVTTAFPGPLVFAELKKRGYVTHYDGASNQFKILVSNI